MFWRIMEFIFVILAIVFIPLFVYFSASPWHSIRVFASDVALLTIIVVVLLGVSGVLAIYHSWKKYKTSSS